MTLSEYLNRLKDERNLTLAQIADISGVPAGTVQRIMSGSTENPAFQAVVEVIKALGGSVDEYAGITKAEPAGKRDTVFEDKIIGIYTKVIKDKNRKIAVLFGVLMLFVIGAAILMIYDSYHGNMGYIRYVVSAYQRIMLWLR